MTRETFYTFIASIDNSVARQDGPLKLSDCIECSATANMFDTAPGDDWSLAFRTAEMVLDEWQSYYPELVIT